MTLTYNTLITGANKGLGRDLLVRYLSQPDQLVIAAVRNPAHATSQELLKLPAGPGSSVLLVKIDSAVQADAAKAINELQTQHKLEKLDLVIANAGIFGKYPYIKDLDIADLREHIEVNVAGPVWLFQATLPLLMKASAPKWAAMSSGAGSLGGTKVFPHPNAAYGASKAMLNFHTLKIHCEHPEITAIALDPGFVQTESGNDAALKLGFEQAFITVDEACSGVKKVLDEATREAHSGRFLGYDGLDRPW